MYPTIVEFHPPSRCTNLWGILAAEVLVCCRRKTRTQTEGRTLQGRHSAQSDTVEGCEQSSRRKYSTRVTKPSSSKGRRPLGQSTGYRSGTHTHTYFIYVYTYFDSFICVCVPCTVVGTGASGQNGSRRPRVEKTAGQISDPRDHTSETPGE